LFFDSRCSYLPGAARRYAPADASSTRGGSTSVRGRVRSPHMAKLWAASACIAKGSCAPRAAAPWDRQTDRQTDGSRYRLMTLYSGGITSLRRSSSDHSIDAARSLLRSGCNKAAVRHCCYPSTGQTDRQTDRQTLYRYIDVYRLKRALSINNVEKFDAAGTSACSRRLNGIDISSYII